VYVFAHYDYSADELNQYANSYWETLGLTLLAKS